MTDAAAPSGPATSGATARPGGLRGLTPSGEARVPVAWSLYDFANTIFSFAVVSGAIGLYLVKPEQFGERDGNVLLSVAIIVSVGINALVSPILGAISDFGGRRMPFLLFFTALCIGATFFIADVPALVRPCLVHVANFAYQAALIYYDATLKTVSYPETRGRMSGIGTAIGYCGTVFVGLAIFLLDIPVADRFRLTALLFPVFAIPIFLIVREPVPRRPTASRSRTSSARSGSSAARSSTPGPSRASAASSSAASSTPMRSTPLIVVMSVVTTKALGVSDATANVILLLLTLVAIVMSFVLGRAGRPPRPQADARHVLGSWVVGLLLGVVALGFGPSGLAPFLVAGAILGSGLGGVTVADRVLMVRLSPPERIGEFFGLYGLVGKGSQVVGQLLYALIILLFLDTLGTGAYQIAVVSLLVTMLHRPLADLARPRRLGRIRRRAGRLEVPHLPERLAPANAPIEPR